MISLKHALRAFLFLSTALLCVGKTSQSVTQWVITEYKPNSTEVTDTETLSSGYGSSTSFKANYEYTIQPTLNSGLTATYSLIAGSEYIESITSQGQTRYRLKNIPRRTGTTSPSYPSNSMMFAAVQAGNSSYYAIPTIDPTDPEGPTNVDPADTVLKNSYRTSNLYFTVYMSDTSYTMYDIDISKLTTQTLTRAEVFPTYYPHYASPDRLPATAQVFPAQFSDAYGNTSSNWVSNVTAYTSSTDANMSSLNASIAAIKTFLDSGSASLSLSSILPGRYNITYTSKSHLYSEKAVATLIVKGVPPTTLPPLTMRVGDPAVQLHYQYAPYNVDGKTYGYFNITGLSTPYATVSYPYDPAPTEPVYYVNVTAVSAGTFNIPIVWSDSTYYAGGTAMQQINVVAKTAQVATKWEVIGYKPNSTTQVANSPVSTFNNPSYSPSVNFYPGVEYTITATLNSGLTPVISLASSSDYVETVVRSGVTKYRLKDNPSVGYALSYPGIYFQITQAGNATYAPIDAMLSTGNPSGPNSLYSTRAYYLYASATTNLQYPNGTSYVNKTTAQSLAKATPADRYFFETAAYFYYNASTPTFTFPSAFSDSYGNTSSNWTLNISYSGTPTGANIAKRDASIAALYTYVTTAQATLALTNILPGNYTFNWKSSSRLYSDRTTGYLQVKGTLPSTLFPDITVAIGDDPLVLSTQNAPYSIPGTNNPGSYASFDLTSFSTTYATVAEKDNYVNSPPKYSSIRITPRAVGTFNIPVSYNDSGDSGYAAATINQKIIVVAKTSDKAVTVVPFDLSAYSLCCDHPDIYTTIRSTDGRIPRVRIATAGALQSIAEANPSYYPNAPVGTTHMLNFASSVGSTVTNLNGIIELYLAATDTQTAYYEFKTVPIVKGTPQLIWNNITPILGNSYYVYDLITVFNPVTGLRLSKDTTNTKALSATPTNGIAANATTFTLPNTTSTTINVQYLDNCWNTTTLSGVAKASYQYSYTHVTTGTTTNTNPGNTGTYTTTPLVQDLPSPTSTVYYTYGSQEIDLDERLYPTYPKGLFTYRLVTTNSSLKLRGTNSEIFYVVPTSTELPANVSVLITPTATSPYKAYSVKYATIYFTKATIQLLPVQGFVVEGNTPTPEVQINRGNGSGVPLASYSMPYTADYYTRNSIVTPKETTAALNLTYNTVRSGNNYTITANSSHGNITLQQPATAGTYEVLSPSREVTIYTPNLGSFQTRVNGATKIELPSTHPDGATPTSIIKLSGSSSTLTWSIVNGFSTQLIFQGTAVGTDTYRITWPATATVNQTTAVVSVQVLPAISGQDTSFSLTYPSNMEVGTAYTLTATGSSTYLISNVKSENQLLSSSGTAISNFAQTGNTATVRFGVAGTYSFNLLDTKTGLEKNYKLVVDKGTPQLVTNSYNMNISSQATSNNDPAINPVSYYSYGFKFFTPSFGQINDSFSAYFELSGASPIRSITYNGVTWNQPIFFITSTNQVGVNAAGTGTFKVTFRPTSADSSWKAFTAIITLKITLNVSNQMELYTTGSSFYYGDAPRTCFTCRYYNSGTSSYVTRQDLLRLEYLPSTQTPPLNFNTATGVITAKTGASFFAGTTQFRAYCAEIAGSYRASNSTVYSITTYTKSLQVNFPSTAVYQLDDAVYPAATWYYYNELGNQVSGANILTDFVDPYGITYNPALAVTPISTETPGTYKYVLENLPPGFEASVNGSLTVNARTSRNASITLTQPLILDAGSTTTFEYSFKDTSNVAIAKPVTFTITGNATFLNGTKTLTTSTSPVTIVLGASGNVQVALSTPIHKTASEIYGAETKTTSFIINRSLTNTVTVPSTENVRATLGVPAISGVIQIPCGTSFTLPTKNAQNYPISYRPSAVYSFLTINNTTVTLDTSGTAFSIIGTVQGDADTNSAEFTVSFAPVKVTPPLVLPSITIYGSKPGQTIELGALSTSPVALSMSSPIGTLAGTTLTLSGTTGSGTLTGTVSSTDCYNAATTSTTILVTASKKLVLSANPSSAVLIVAQGDPINTSTTLTFQLLERSALTSPVTLNLTKQGSGVVYTETITNTNQWTRQTTTSQGILYEKDVPQAVTTAGTHTWTGSFSY